MEDFERALIRAALEEGGRQGRKTEQERSALTQGLLRTVAENLTRRAQGRCDLQPAR